MPLTIIESVLTGPPPYAPADILTFLRGASEQDFDKFIQRFTNQWNIQVVPACADEVTRILAAPTPLSDADVTLFVRGAGADQIKQMEAQYPDFSSAIKSAYSHWPLAETPGVGPITPLPNPPAPTVVPAGPPVTVAPAGRPDIHAFLDVLPGSPPQFTTGNDTVRLLGYNISPPGTTPCTVTQDNFTAVCETAANNGGNSVRLFGFQSMGGPNNWQSFDAALDTAKAHGLKVVWVLGNQWGDCQKIEPGTAADGYHQPEWYRTGYKQAGGGNALSYRDFSLATVQRYAQNPTVAIWSLLNEAEAGTVVQGTTCPNETLSSQAMTGFVADMASAIRAVDANHLLTLGTRGQENNCGLQGSHYLAVQEPMDVLTLHSYDMSYERAQNLSAQALSAGKPLIMAEHGQCANPDDCSLSYDASDLASRACTMQKLAVGFAGLGVAGEIPWFLEPPSSTADGYRITATDPLIERLKNFASGGSFPVDEVC